MTKYESIMKFVDFEINLLKKIDINLIDNVQDYAEVRFLETARSSDYLKLNYEPEAICALNKALRKEIRGES